MVAATLTGRCSIPGCRFITFATQPTAAMARHHQQSHQAGSNGDPRIQQNRGLLEKLRLVSIERDALREHLEKFHICSVRCSGEKRP